MSRLVILGAGGYGRTVADVAEQFGRFESICFLDDGHTGDGILGTCVDYLRYADGQTCMYPAFGSNTARLSWLDKLAQAGIPTVTLIHPSAYVSPRAQVEEGTVILPKAVVNTGCHIGRGCIINLGAIVDHGCILEPGVHVCLGAIVKAENHIPGAMKIEAGQVIENRTYPL